MVRLLGEPSGIREAIATAIVALSAVFAMYAVATVIGPTPIPSFVVLPTFAVGFLVAALFAYTVRPRRVRFALTAAVVTATTVYGGSWLLHGSASVRSTATHGVFGFVLVALGLGAGAVWLAEDTARFIEGEATPDNGE